MDNIMKQVQQQAPGFQTSCEEPDLNTAYSLHTANITFSDTIWMLLTALIVVIKDTEKYHNNVWRGRHGCGRG